MNWIIETVLSAVVSSVIVVGFLSAIITKMQISIELKANGIKRIYPYGRNIKSLEKKMQNCKTIKILGFSALGFTHSYSEILIEHIAHGGKVEFLLAKENSEFVTEAAQMEGRKDTVIADSIKQTLDLLRTTKKKALKRAQSMDSTCGTIEVRQYNTEIRNQLIICKDDKETHAWMSILIPPLAAVQCKMIEYSKSDDCIAYYDVIWERSTPREIEAN